MFLCASLPGEDNPKGSWLRRTAGSCDTVDVALGPLVQMKSSAAA